MLSWKFWTRSVNDAFVVAAEPSALTMRMRKQNMINAFPSGIMDTKLKKE